MVVASELYRFACLNLNNPNPTNRIPAYLYYVSKYANIVFTKELARRLDGTGVTANCLHPGMIDSGIWRNVPCPVNYLVQGIAKAFFKVRVKSIEEGILLYRLWFVNIRLIVGSAIFMHKPAKPGLMGAALKGRRYSDC